MALLNGAASGQKARKESFKVFSETAQRQAKLWLELSCLQLDNWSLPEGIEGLSLVADQLHEALPHHKIYFMPAAIKRRDTNSRTGYGVG